MPPVSSNGVHKPPQVLAIDRDDLIASGLSGETIRENELRSVTDGIEIPYRHPLTGEKDGFSRIRYRNPKSGQKYSQKKGTGKRLYVPKRAIPPLNDGKAPILIVEGEKKALKAQQDLPDYAAVGVGGIWNGTDGDDQNPELIPDFAGIPLVGRVVYIAFDFDPKTRTQKDVAAARTRLARALRKAGAKVILVRLPPGPGGEKNGMDDLLIAEGRDTVLSLFRRAEDKTEGVDAMDLKNEGELEELESLGVFGRNGYLLKRLANIISAAPKAGKTTFLYCSIPAWLARGERVLYLTEESLDVWRDRLRRLDVIDRPGLQIVPAFGVHPDELLDRVKRGQETVVVVDTMRSLGLLGEDENDNSGVARRLEPWLTACREGGKTFVGIHHERKTGGTHGRGVSGAHALPAAMDVILQLGFGKHDNERTLSVLSRLGTPKDLTYTRMEDGTLSVFDEGAGELIAMHLAILSVPKGPPGWTSDDYARECKCSKNDAVNALKQWVDMGLIVMTGKGVKADPKMYYRP
jgi:hypothetical protein